MNCIARTSCGQPKKRFGAKGSEAFPVNAPPYDARHTRNVCVLRPFILSRSLSFRAVPNTVRVSGWSFLLILSIAKHLSQKPDKQARMEIFYPAQKETPQGLFCYDWSFAVNASSASSMASSKEGWGRIVRSICSAVRWLTMASLIWLIMSLACWHMS